jgi:hypothetical protein
MHVTNNTVNQSYCLTRSAYLALLAGQAPHKPPAVHALYYKTFLMLVLPIAFAMVICCVLPAKLM